MSVEDSQLWRTAYVSVASDTLKADPRLVLNEVESILVVSRSNNREVGVTGVLYYYRGCFFQCLEGSKLAVQRLIAKVAKDARHGQFRVLIDEPLDARVFSSWSMKYVELVPEIRHYLESVGLGRQMHLLTEKDSRVVLDVLSQHAVDSVEPSIESTLGTTLAPTAKATFSPNYRLGVYVGAVILLAIALLLFSR